MDGRPIITRRKGIYLLPNLLTTCGLFAGFYSIVASIDGNFQLTAWAIFAAMLFDSLDGRVARLTSTSSEFGKEYDSLADMVSFGVAPALVAPLKWALFNHGVDLMGTGGMTSSAHTDADIDATVEAFGAAIADLRAEGLIG